MKRLFLLALIVFLYSNQYVFAAITIPYTVDEKSQVIFGDSGFPVDNNLGLENYAANYLDDYLHITFTFTHHGSSFASYPPRLYVTNKDPRATTTAEIRWSSNVYELSPTSHNPDHVTNWYLYDIQFDSTGYSVFVKQAGATTTASFYQNISDLTDNDWVALANLYPLAEPPNEFSVAFVPLQIHETAGGALPNTIPVIIVPGIMGTRLLEDGVIDNLIWPDTTQIVTSIADDFLDALKMTVDGNAINESIMPGDVIRQLSGADYFEGLFNQLLLDGYEENINIFESPYDWRLDIEISALKLKEEIDEIKRQTGLEKVNLVAHSMGGLLVKKYLKDYGGESIEKFIDIGTPHVGAPSAYKILMYGDDLGVRKFFGLININANKIKEISQNMPSIYQLLPSQEYLEGSESGYYLFNGINGNNRLTFEETANYLKTEGRNGLLVDRAREFHQEIDNLDPADYGVKTYNFIGCGTPTLGQFYLLEGGDHPIYNIMMVNGDGTVPIKSAEFMKANETFYVKNAQHALMPSTVGVKNLIAEILSSTSTLTTTENFDLSPYPNLGINVEGCTIPDGKIVSFHSPIDLHIYDSDGKHAGPDNNGDIENEISGVAYEIIEDNKFAYLPNGVEYTVKGTSGGVGSFDVRIQDLVDGEINTTTLFADIPLTFATQAQFTVGANIPNQIKLDIDNDSIFESSKDTFATYHGILESSGKIVVSAQADKPSSGVSSKVQFIVTNDVVPETVPSSVTEIIVETTSTPIPGLVKIKKESVFEGEGEGGEAGLTRGTREEMPTANTAIVYKSFTQKVSYMLKKIWLFIVDKLW